MQHQIISYIPQKRTPFLIYTEERLDDKSIIIAPETYDLLREHYTERVNSVIKYCINDQTCRSRQLTSYFGEESNTDCGECDVCRSKRERYTRAEEFDEIFDYVFNKIKSIPHSLSEITANCPYDPIHTAEIIRKMIDDGIAVQKSDGNIYAAEKKEE